MDCRVKPGNDEGCRTRASPSSVGEGATTAAEFAARRRTVCGNSHLTMSNSPDLLVPASTRSRGAFSAPGVCDFASLTPNRGVGGAPRNVRVLGGTPVRHAVTRRTRRLRGALRPMTRDARLSALHRGGFGLPGPRFRLLRRPPPYNGGHLPSGSVQRAPRTQVVVPGGRGPCLPGRTVTSRRRRAPRLAPPSGSSPETPLDERG